MSNDPLFLISIDSAVESEDRATLLRIIESDVQLRPQSQKQFGPGWIAFLAFVQDAAIVAGGATAMIKLAKEIINWRQKRRSETPRVNINIIIQRTGRPKLKLSEAQDAEILEWFSDK